MGITKRAQYKVFNGTDFDVINFESEADYQGIYRQALINGNFDVWQRGTIFTGIGYTADRWTTFYDGTMTKTYSRQQFPIGQTAVPNNPTYFFRTQVTSVSGQNGHSMGQSIEDVSILAGLTVTASFWAKADAARQIRVNFKQVFGSGGSADVQLNDVFFNLTTSWQKFTATFNIPSIAGKTIGANNFTVFFIGFPANIPFTIDIAQVQVNVGTTALPFTPKSFAQELLDCQRYYEKSYDYSVYPGVINKPGGVMQNIISVNGALFNPVFFKVEKRINPTITLYSYETGASGYIRNLSKIIDISSIPGNVGQHGFSLWSNSSSLNVGDNVAAHWVADSEL